jgi:PAS domain S-box-containing protein
VDQQLAGQRHETDAVLRVVPIGVVVLDSAGLVQEVNPAAAAILGRPVEQLLGSDLHALVHEPSTHVPAHCPFRWAGTAAEPAVEHVAGPAGTARTVRCRVEALIEHGTVTGTVVTFDPAVPAEAVGGGSRERFLSRLEQALLPLEDPDEITSTVTRLVGEHVAADRCVYTAAEPDQNHVTPAAGYARGLPDPTDRMAMSEFGADALRCMRAGVPFVLADAETDPRVLPDQRETYLRTGCRAAVCVPLHSGGQFVAAMIVQQRTPRVWTAPEVDVLTTSVGRCWESLQRAHALAAVRESEERFRLLVERATEAIWVADDSLRFIDVNPAACTLLGYSREEHLALGIPDLVRPEDAHRLDGLLAKITVGASVTEVWELRRSDGSTVAVELSIRFSTRGRLQAIGRDITERLRAEAEREALLEREQEANRQLQLLQRRPAQPAVGRPLGRRVEAARGGRRRGARRRRPSGRARPGVERSA